MRKSSASSALTRQAGEGHPSTRHPVGPRLSLRLRCRCCSPTTMTWSRQSRRMVPITRSQYGFCQGDCGAVSALPGPVKLEALAMPTDHGLGLHEDQGVLPVWPPTAEHDPESAVRLGQLGAFGLALQNGQLLSQSEVFESELALRPEAGSGGCEKGVQQRKHGDSSTPSVETSTIVRSTEF